MNGFALKLNKKINSTDGNLFWSPYSVFSAVSMVTAGSENETHQELIDALEIKGNKEWESVSAINQTIKSARNANLSMEYANSIWAQKNKKWSENFIFICKDHFDSEINFSDFESHPEESRQEINQWVEQKTKEKIKELLPEKSVSENTRMILCNCIHFKGDWQDKFETKKTFNQTFWGKSKPNSVEFMHRNDEMLAFADEENSVVCLPYVGGKIQMNVFVPHNKDSNGIEQLESKFDEAYINRMLDHCCPIDVRLSMPKFKIESSNGLKESFLKCGVSRAFSDNAQFPMYQEIDGIKIDEIYHKAFVEVNEEGTEAAAATAIATFCCCCMTPEPRKEIVIEADHPFLFTITTDNREILFIGKVSQL